MVYLKHGTARKKSPKLWPGQAAKESLKHPKYREKYLFLSA